jgi:hypothetical protein
MTRRLPTMSASAAVEREVSIKTGFGGARKFEPPEGGLVHRSCAVGALASVVRRLNGPERDR